jgi:RNA polymerase sigma-70 factor (ECF subfamily)
MEQALRRQIFLSEAGAATGDEVTAPEAFVALVERQSRFVFRVAYAVLRNAQDAEDAVQETFLKLYRTNHWTEIRDEKSFLARAAWRVAVSRRKERRQNPQPDEIATLAPDPEAAAMDAQWNATVHRLIDGLPEDLRQPLALSALEELGSREIALIMRIPEGTVRTRIMRARSVLKERLTNLTGCRRAE